MDELSKAYAISYFSKALIMHGDRPEAVRWTEKGQRIHYKALLGIDKDIHGKKVLDYGCGKGDFYQYLKEKNIAVDYTGFDINGELISLARHKYPECRFRVFDIEEESLDDNYDYIFLCGVFNLKVEGLVDTVKNTLTRLFDHCRIALAFNALSAHDPRKATEMHYLLPGKILDYAVKNLSPHVAISHDQIPYDFTMYVRKEAKK